MNYKGIELKDISGTPQVIDPPRKMLVWDDDHNGKEISYESPRKVTVLAIVDSDKLNGRVIAENTGFARYGHCAELPTEYATIRQISRWLAEGNGEVSEGIDIGGGVYCKSSLYHHSGKDDASSEGSALRIRKWDDTEWHEPTLEYMGLEG